MAWAVVGIGSNMQPRTFIAAALDAMERRFGPLRVSRFVQTEPIGRPGQSRYLNGAALLETGLAADELAEALGRIEDDLGRVRTADRFAPRTIDLDLVVYDGEILDNDLQARDFLARAVAEVMEQ
ncbi:MAG: 2-amino-4-hydroxy-6-hydroxymethyldihydropteridine diphosphokinase [Planctomycetota bacterium]